MSDHRDSLRVVLVSPRNPLNIGAAARAMSNFGFLNLRVVNPYEVAYTEAKSAVNASAVLEASVQYATLPEAVGDCNLVIGTASLGHRVLQHSYRRLEQGAKEIRSALSAKQRVALVFGSEKFGLGNDELSYCHSLLYIPTRAEHESMNLGQAVAVCLYELIRDSEAAEASPVPRRTASVEDVERISDLLIQTLEISGYMQSLTAESSRLKIRRLVRRLSVNSQDAKLWLGMLRQVLWKLRS
ncbi:MAG TPA: TrmJ/YjtD family RNA methyltransferase [Bryobacteraceae bacterium]|nr:TrmJ/YjtD family RNA methyltransferase [Bryobacteraceae bacterium]